MTQVEKLGGNQRGRCTQKEHISKLSLLAKSKWDNKWGHYTQRKYFSKLGSFAKSNWINWQVSSTKEKKSVS